MTKVIEQERNGTLKVKCANEVICVEEGGIHQIFVDKKKAIELAMTLLEIAGLQPMENAPREGDTRILAK